MTKRHDRAHDRRRADRPSADDTEPCPECETGTLRFDESYTVPLATGGVAVIPSWICDDCQYGRPVREADQPPLLRRSASHARAGSSPKLMKARSVLQRAAQSITKSITKRKVR